MYVSIPSGVLTGVFLYVTTGTPVGIGAEQIAGCPVAVLDTISPVAFVLSGDLMNSK